MSEKKGHTGDALDVGHADERLHEHQSEPVRDFREGVE